MRGAFRQRPAAWLPPEQVSGPALQLAPGDGLLLFSDGVTECLILRTRNTATNASGAAWSHERSNAEALVVAVMADVEAFAGGAEQTDDITCLAVVLA